MKNIILICVNYNTYDELSCYLRSIEVSYKHNSSSINLKVIVADNSDKKLQIENQNNSFELEQVYTDNNLGYFGAISYAIKKSKVTLSTYDYILFSNVDLEISENFFEKLVSINLDAGCLAPSIITKEEQINRNPKILQRYSIKKLKILKLMYKFPLLYKLYTRFFYKSRRKKIDSKNIEAIYAAHGSFMIFTKKFSEFLQTMNYPVFLFGEEIFIAENLRKLDLKTIYCPSLLIYDKDHASTSKMKNKFYYKCNYDALKYIIKEFYNE